MPHCLYPIQGQRHFSELYIYSVLIPASQSDPHPAVRRCGSFDLHQRVAAVAKDVQLLHSDWWSRFPLSVGIHVNGLPWHAIQGGKGVA